MSLAKQKGKKRTNNAKPRNNIRTKSIKSFFSQKNSSGSAEKIPSEESNSIDNFSDNDIDLTTENTNNDETVLQDYEMDQNQPIGGDPNIPDAININAVSVSTNASIQKCFGYVP